MNSSDKLGNTTVDHLVSVFKAAVNLVPFAGPVLSEIIQVSIPHQRSDRVVDFIQKLASRCNDLEEKVANNTQNLYYLEEGIRISANSYQEEKRDWLSKVITEGINEKIQIDLVEKLLSIISDITVEQVIILNYHYVSNDHLQRGKLEKEYPEILNSQYLISNKNHEYYENNFLFNTKKLDNYGLIKKIITTDRDYSISFPSKYDRETLKYIINNYLNEIYKSLKELNQIEQYSISSIGRIFIDIITEKKVYDIEF